jgi:hypothetical protein
MVKSIALLSSVILLCVVDSASAIDARDCASMASRMKAAVRTEFLASCLDRVALPENVRQEVRREKQAACERNAKNLMLHDELKSRYVGICLERNEAALANADAGKRVFRIPPEAAASAGVKKSAPVVSIPQKEQVKKRNVKPRGRQLAAK